MRCARTRQLPRWLAMAMVAAPVLCVLPGCSLFSSKQDEAWYAPIVSEFIPPSPSQVARDAFNVYDPDKRRTALALLSSSNFGGEGPYVRAYRLLLDDPDGSVRAAAIAALGLHGQRSDVPSVARGLKDEESFVRWEAALALQKLHDPAAIAPLIEAVNKDDDADVRMAAAGALGQYHDPRVFPVLVGALDDSDYGVAWHAHRSLKTLTDYDFGPDAALWNIWGNQRGGDLYKYQRPFTWQPFVKPTRWWNYFAFWNLVPGVGYNPRDREPRTPTGLESNAAGAGGGS